MYLQDTVAETTNIGVSDGSIVDENSEGDITFRPFGYVFSPSPIDTQIAGRPFNITLTAAGQTPAQPECGVIEEYTGVKSLNFWSDAPATTSTQVNVESNNIATNEAASTPQNITFNAGVATISTLYNDVGQISLSAKDETGIGDPVNGTTDEIIGGISPFVVRPFAFEIQVTGDPNSNSNLSPVFANAGDNFATTIRSTLWESADDVDNDGVPDIGSDLSDNGITPNITNIAGSVSLTPLAQIITNSNGVLGDTTVDFSDFAASNNVNAGSASVTQSWTEAGILTINAISNNFLSSGDNVSGARANIGRFKPAYFTFSNITAINSCAGFTYGGYLNALTPGLTKNGQNFTLSGTIQARNSLNNITTNYANSVSNNFSSGFIKFDKSDLIATGIDSDVPATINTLNIGNNLASITLTDNNNGTVNFSESAAHYQFESERSPVNLASRLTISDSDGVLTLVNFDSNSIEVRLGRMFLQDSFGPETAPLEMRLITEYYNGTDWTLNTNDSCTTYNETMVSFDNTSYSDNLNAGESSISAIGTQTLTTGISAIGNGIWFSAPGTNNYGTVQINLDLSSQPWLQYDWDNSDGLSQLDITSANLNFGYYRGSDRVIYWQEVN